MRRSEAFCNGVSHMRHADVNRGVSVAVGMDGLRDGCHFAMGCRICDMRMHIGGEAWRAWTTGSGEDCSVDRVLEVGQR